MVNLVFQDKLVQHGKDGIATVKTVVDTINNSGWKANAKANGGKLDGNSTATVVKPR